MIRIDDVWPTYCGFQAGRKTPKSWANDRSILQRTLPKLPQVVDEIRPLHVDDLILQWSAEGRAPKTLNRLREVLHTFFAWLVRREQLAVNPVSRVERRPEPAPEIVFLELADVDLLLEACAGDPLRPIVAVLVYAGLRRSEACWLRVEDYDRGRELLAVRRKTIHGQTWQPKTGRNRVVPVSTRLQAVLHDLPATSPAGWLLPSPQGYRWDPDNLSQRFRKLVRARGWRWKVADLRHTFGTHLVRRGVSLAHTAALMGNSPEVVLRHYAAVHTEGMHPHVEF